MGDATLGKIVEQTLAAFSHPAQREQGVDLCTPGVVLHGSDGVERGSIASNATTMIRLADMNINRFESSRSVECGSVTDSLAVAVQMGSFPIPQTSAPPGN